MPQIRKQMDPQRLAQYDCIPGKSFWMHSWLCLWLVLYLASFRQGQKNASESPSCKSYAILFKHLLNPHSTLVQEAEELTSFDILYHRGFQLVIGSQNCPITFTGHGAWTKSANVVPHTICLIFIRYESSQETAQ